jgi:hypothetical protein
VAHIDYDEVFLLVARLDSVCLLITLTTHEVWEVHHMDVKLAFLNGDLQVEVYVKQPMGSIIASKEHKSAQAQEGAVRAALSSANLEHEAG